MTTTLQEGILDTAVCGFHQYALTPPFHLTYASQNLCAMLGLSKEELVSDAADLYAARIHPDDRRQYARFLYTLAETQQSQALTYRLVKSDGEVFHVQDTMVPQWLDDGTLVGCSTLSDVSALRQSANDQYRLRREWENQRYIQAISKVYDKIFEFDRAHNTIRCLYGQNSSVFKWLENIPMQITEAIEKWTINTVHQEDRETVLRFFSAQAQGAGADSKPPQINYRALSSQGEMKHYTGIFLKLDPSISLFCCRNVAEADVPAALPRETRGLKAANEPILEVDLPFTEGIAAFEVAGDLVRPLYASNNIREFFGYSQEEWLSLMQTGTSLEDFVSHSGSSYESYVNLLENGEAEFTYYDLSENTERRIKAVCSQKTADGNSLRYVMLYNMDEPSASRSMAGPPAVSIRTFGYFDVFVGGKAIAFRTQKAKELFALLVDRRGGYISSDEAIGFLWEDEPVNPVTLARYRKVALRLKNILEEYGIADIVESVGGKRRLVMEKVQCDLYDYLSGKEDFAQSFNGSYLTNYSWAETTLGALATQHMKEEP